MPATATQTEVETLQQLNRDYIRSVQTSDVPRFDEILSDDFLCSNPDGSLVDRAGFLAQTARPVTISNLEARDVVVRILGDVALIHARTTYTLADGRTGGGRYTDVWARREGRWLCVSAHVTRSCGDGARIATPRQPSRERGASRPPRLSRRRGIWHSVSTRRPDRVRRAAEEAIRDVRARDRRDGLHRPPAHPAAGRAR